MSPSLPEPILSLLAARESLYVMDVYLYPPSQLSEMNAVFPVQGDSPRYLTVGNNGGGEAFVVDLVPPHPVFLVGHGSMHPNDFSVIARGVAEWLGYGCPMPAHDDSEDGSRRVDVYVQRSLESRGLLAVRKLLAQSTPLHELRANLTHLPFRLLSSVPYGRLREKLKILEREVPGAIIVRPAERNQR